VICVGLLTANDAAAEPNATVVAFVKLLPLIVTEVAPVAGPLLGSTEITDGRPMNVY
jgi:hypothetical protein